MRRLAILVLLLWRIGTACESQPEEVVYAIERGEWPFKSVMVHEARRAGTEGWSVENDGYGRVWVDSVPLFGTELIDRLECRDGRVWIHWNDSGTRKLAAATNGAPETKLALAFYVDQEFVNAPSVQAPLEEGRLSMPSSNRGPMD